MTRATATGPARGRGARIGRVVVLLGALVLAACGPSPLAHSRETADSLARAVLDAIEHQDRSALADLALSEREFRVQVWPSLPAARPERNLPADYVWSDLEQKSEASLAATLATHGGRRYTLVAVRFAGPPSEYGGFRVHRRSIFSLRDTAGVALELRLAGSLVERAGRWKVFSYLVGD